MFRFNMFEKTPLDGYNKVIDDFRIKFEIFSELKELQKIGRMEISKEDFYNKKENDETENEEAEKREKRIKILKKIKSRKINREGSKKIEVYVPKKDEENSDEENSDEENSDEENADEENADEENADEENADEENADEENAGEEKEGEEKEGEEKEDEEKEDEEKEETKKCKEKKKYYKYYIFDVGYFQKLSRWWYSENREKTNEYIQEDFSELIKILNDIKNIYETYSLNIYYKKLLKKIHKFINEITPGLYHLKKTYSNNKKIKAQIDSIILTLLDFKNETKIKKNPISLLSILHKHNKKHIIF